MQTIQKYGKEFPAGITPLDIELWCYAHDDRDEGERGRLTRFDHFRNAVDLLWNNPNSSRRVIWNDWTIRMVKAMIRYRYTGLAGAGSSGKSDAAALFCLVEFLSAPTETLCLVLSTTLKGAKLRIWKSINELWGSLEAQWEAQGVTMPAKMVNSKGILVGMDVHGRWSENVGIHLIAADKDNEKEAAKKLKGLKAPAEGYGRLRMVADEFSDLGASVLTAMLGNLNTNPDFKGIGMANPGSKLTPFGKFVEPLAGWNSLSVGMENWETKYGICLSFDATKSPRMLTPEHEITQSDGTLRHKLYNWMPSQQAIDQMREEFGEDSIEFWAQVRGMFCPTGAERTIWSEMELINTTEPVKEEEWDMAPYRLRLAALDPAFTTDGDRSPIMWAECGTIKGVKTMNIMGFKVAQEIPMGEENTEVTVSEHVINQFMELCNYQGIPAKRAAYDATGGGTVFGQWMKTKWSGAVLGVRFGEAPVERRADSEEEGELIYANRVTQLWVQPKALVRAGQIRGLPIEVIEELVQRKYHATKNEGSKTCIESKKDMKKRTGKSPDLADTFVILVENAIQNGLLDIVEIRINDRKTNKAWKQQVATGLRQGPRKSIVAMPMAKRLR